MSNLRIATSADRFSGRSLLRSTWNASLAQLDWFCRVFSLKLARGTGEAHGSSEISENGKS
jgi:hypothetical protein